MRVGRNTLHYAKFIGFLAVVLMIWLTSIRPPDPPKFASGQPKTTGAFLNGKAEGAWTWWYENGRKMTEGNFTGGKRNGIWETWYEDGSKKSEGIYQDDKLNGRYIHWYKNGGVKQTGNYLQDKREGAHQQFDSAGILLEERQYAAGVRVHNKQ